MRWLPIALILLAGCVSPDVDVSGEPTGEVVTDDEYWLVYIEGNETRDPPSHVMCSVIWAYDIDLDGKTIHYADDEYSANQVGDRPQTLVASSVWDASHCPIAYHLSDARTITIPTNGLGDVTIRIHDDGSVRVAGKTLQPGQQARLSGSDTQSGPDGLAIYHTELTVHAMGAWPLDGLRPGQQR